MQMEIANVSTKGQVVIPGAIRKRLGISAGTKLVVMTDGESVLMKPLAAPRLETFEALIGESHRAAAEAGMTPAAVEQAVAEVRRARGR